MNFLCNQWCMPEKARKLAETSLYVACQGSCTCIQWLDNQLCVTIIEDLSSNQEEADTKMFLHAQHAAINGHQEVIIYSSDTDVEVMACYFQSKIAARIILDAGVHSHRRLIDIHAVVSNLGPDLCKALPGVHALTGCDSVSAFAGCGKKKAFHLIKTTDKFCKSLQNLGSQITPSSQLMEEIENFVCALYGNSSSSVNEARYTIFCRAGKAQNLQLAPSKDALSKHIQRANFQATIWRNALQADHSCYNPNGNGWKEINGELIIDWMSQLPAPHSMLQFLSCGCGGSCNTQRCSCVKHHLPCTDYCSCTETCANCKTHEENDSDENQSDDEDNDE